jgi:hypothetical protein
MAGEAGRGSRSKEEVRGLAGDAWGVAGKETPAAQTSGGAGKETEDSFAAANEEGGENTKDWAADKPRDSTGERRTVVSPEEMVAAPSGAARQSGEDAIARGGRPERPGETPEASSFERRRSLPAESNEFIVLHTRNKRANTLLKGARYDAFKQQHEATRHGTRSNRTSRASGRTVAAKGATKTTPQSNHT